MTSRTWMESWVSKVLVVDRPQYVADWVASQSGEVAPTVDAALGFEYEGDLRAGVYFDAMTGNNIFAHIASTLHTLPRSLVIATAIYVYEQAELDRMTFAVAAGNHKTVKLVLSMGAELEGTLEKAAGRGLVGCDLYLFVLWKDSPFIQRILGKAET